MNNKSIFSFLSFTILISVIFNSCITEKETEITSQIDLNAPVNSLSEPEIKNGWKLLFDGKKIEHWRGYNMVIVPESWEVADGILIINNEGLAESHEGLITKQEYNNFAFSFEFKLTPGANSGVLFQVGEDTSYTYPYQTGVEYQLIDDKSWPGPLEDWQKCAANYAMHPPLVDATKEIGEWNHGMIIVEKNNVRFYLNGKMTVEYEKYSPEWTELRNSGKWADYPDYAKNDIGHIALQNHGAVVYFRNLKIKEL